MKFVEMESNSSNNVMMVTLSMEMGAQILVQNSLDGSAAVDLQVSLAFAENIFQTESKSLPKVQ